MPVVTRSAAKKLAQQKATEPEPSVRETRKRACKAAPEDVPATGSPSATGKATNTRRNHSSSSPTRRSAIRPYPPPTYIGLPALPEEVTFSDASEVSIERFKRLAYSSGGVPIASSSLASTPSLVSSSYDIGRAYTPAPSTPPPPPQTTRNRKPFLPRTPEKRAVPRPLQRSPAIRIEPISPVLPGTPPPLAYPPGTRLTLIENDMSPEGIARREGERARRSEAIRAKYWAELLEDKKEKDRYLLGGLELLEAQGLAPPHVNCPIHPDHGFHHRHPWIRRSVSPFNALTR